MHKIIPDIEEKIEKTLKKLELEPKDSPCQFIEKTGGNKHRYSSVCTNPQGKRVIFYARLHDNQDAKQKMERELSFFKSVIKQRFKASKFIPEVYLLKIEKDFEWLVRQYFTANPLGINEQLNKKIEKKDAVLLAEAVCQIKDVPVPALKHVSLKKFSFKQYLKSLDQIERLVKDNILTKKEARGITKLLEKNTALLKKENRYFCHSDLNLGNIIISRGSVKIIDWESIQINNLAYDISYMFCHLWQVKTGIRKTLIKTYFNLLCPEEKSIFERIFSIVIFYLATGAIDFIPPEVNTSVLKKRKEFFKKLLKKSCQGIEGLTEV